MDKREAMKIADRIAHAADLVAARNRADADGRRPGDEQVLIVQTKQGKILSPLDAILRDFEEGN